VRAGEVLRPLRDLADLEPFRDASDPRIAQRVAQIDASAPMLDWSFCEELADVVREVDPAHAAFLYELAVIGYEEARRTATASGEAFSNTVSLGRVRDKQLELPRRR
jgi:hypothetical protein